MAGCICEKEDQLYQDSENLVMKKLVASGIGGGVARQQAHETVLLRRSVDERYKEQDMEGREGIGAEFTFTKDGDVYFPEFNGRLNELYQNQKEIRSKEYNPEEHKTVLTAYESIKNGASQAAHIVHHYDKNGQLDVRDVVVLTFDHKSNRGTMHVLNISRDGKNHDSLEDAYEAMKSRLDGFGREVKNDDVCLIIRDEKPLDPILLFRDHTPLTTEHSSAVYGEYKKIQEDRPVNGECIKEPHPLIRPAIHADKINDPMPKHLPFFLQRLLGRDEKGEIAKKETQKSEQQKDHNPTKKKQESQKKQKSRERTVLVREITLHKKKMEEGRKSLIFIEQTSIAVGGALYILESFNKPIIRLSKKEKKMLRRQERKERYIEKQLEKKAKKKRNNNTNIQRGSEMVVLKGKKEHRDEKKRLKVDRKETAGIVLQRTETKVHKKRKKEIQKSKKTETQHIVFLFKEKRKEKRTKESMKGHVKAVGLMRAFETLSKKIRKIEHQSQKKKDKYIVGVNQELHVIREQKIRYICALIACFRALILFECIRHTKQSNVSKSDESTYELGKKVKKEKKLQNMNSNDDESTPWILLSIIWHMSVIREHGQSVFFPTQRKKKKKDKGKNKVSRIGTIRNLSTYGLIYTYNP